ncbi:MAG: S-layer homology domain-containing protein [Oscillospiraceae bacterium]|nr:S-layer homology domain-containing protein [Oscillospiraceae bacterium]
MYRGGKGFFRKLSLLLAGIIVAVTLFAAPGVNFAGAVGTPVNSAVQYLYNDYITNGPNNSDGGVGAYALYMLTQAGVDVSTWDYEGTGLDDAVISAINDDLSDSGTSAKRLAQDLAAADALGEVGLADDLVDELLDRESSSGFDNDAYSDIPAYDLLGRTGYISVIDEVYAKNYILAAQETTVSEAAYGSFGGGWGPDFMVTAQAVRALHYLDPGDSDSEIQDAIDEALSWMEAQQQDDGSFTIESWGYWDDKVIDTSELVAALDALGMDPAVWESGGKTATDYLLDDALNADGSFGSSGNAMDAIWALCAYNAMDEPCTVWRFYLDPSSTDLNIDGTEQMLAVWQNAGGSVDVTLDAVWSAADSSIASVDSSGLVTALTAGETVVSAVYDGLTAAAGVTVSSSSPGGNAGSDVTVGLAVVGSNSDLLYGPSSVFVDDSNEWGLTALGALDASGLSYNTSPWAFGDLVDSIEGLANSGLSGWMYTVNGVSPAVGADQYEIEEDDEIIFYYSESMDQEPPRWDDLEDLPAGGGAAASADLPDPVSDGDLDDALKNAGSAGLVALEADDNETALSLSSGQISKILDTDKPLAVTIQGVQFTLTPDSLEVKELLAEDAAMLQFKVKKLSREDAQKLAEPSAVRLKLAGEIYELTVQVLDEDGTLRDIGQFPGCRVLLPVPAGLEEGAAAGMLKAYWYNEDSGQWEDVGGTYDPNSGAVGFNVDHFSKYALLETIAPPEVKAAFNDIAGHWAQAEIEYMAAKGYVAGVGENQFAPESKITRAEFAAILARMAGLADNVGAAERFSDVPAGAWYRGTVGAVTTAGLVYGTSENSFAPDEPITREQMAAMLVRLMAESGSGMAISDAGAAELLAGFSDTAGISGWAYSPVALSVRDGLMVGRERGMFIPLGDATRAEAIVVLYRVLQKLPQAGL